MDDFEAINIAEGADDNEYTTEEYLTAWQHLINTGLAWRLQGWFGRTASRLIDEGYCSSPSRAYLHDLPPPFNS